MALFVGDGHKDREALAQQLVGQGYLWAREEYVEGIVAVVLSRLLEGVADDPSVLNRAWHLWRVVMEIVSCAENDGLLE